MTTKTRSKRSRPAEPEPVKRLTKERVEEYFDGTWIETDAEMTSILRTWDRHKPHPAGAVHLWRRQQLLDQLAYAESLEPQPEAIFLDDRELATVLAGLRHWQRDGITSACDEQDVATDGGTLTPLTVDEIDALCERINR